MREISFRYNLLRNGAFFARLRADTEQPPVIRMNASGEIKTSLSGTFAPYAVDALGARREINWFTDEIQPEIVIDGEASPLGVFAASTPAESDRDGARRVKIQAYDRCWRVRDTRSASLLYWPAGTAYLDAVGQLLNAAGISVVMRTPNGAVFQEAREDWDIGVSYLSVVNELLREINYKELWFDASGAAILEPAAVPDGSSIRHVFNSGDKNTRLLPTITRESDIYSAPNVFLVVCANPDKDGNMVARAANENAQSPLSVQRRGREIVSLVTVNNIASQAELQAYADRPRNESMIGGETVEISCGLRPGLGVEDVCGVRYGELSGLCVLKAYSMELAVGGSCDLTLERLVYNLDD